MHDFSEIDIIEKSFDGKCESLPKDLDALIKQFCKPSSNSVMRNVTILSPFSWISSIMYALKTTDCILKHEQKTNLVVDIVGVEDEIGHFNENCCKLFFHVFKNIKNLKLNFCGPDITHILPYDVIKYSFNDERTVVLDFKRLLYENCDFITSDIIISFNCGFHEIQNEYNPWKKAILKMLRHKNVPIIFTSFTLSESKKDCEIFQSIAKNIGINIESIHENQKNPFKNPYPLINVYRHLDVGEQKDVDEPLYYINNFINIFVAMESPPINLKTNISSIASKH